MAFDSTVAGDSANSYLSVADADALASASVGPFATTWLAVGTTQQAKEQALQQATREVNAYLRSSGIARYSATQALLYPRSVDVLSNTPFIPDPVRFATFAQAKFLNANAAVIDAAETRRERGIQSGSEPNVTWSLASEASSDDHLCDEAKGYLTGIFAKATTVRSVVVGTGYSYPVTGDPGLDVLP